MIFIPANWPAPDRIKAGTSLRSGGVSEAPYDQLNLGDHVGDSEKNVIANREIIASHLNLPDQPIWIQQIHGTKAVEARLENLYQEADASFTDKAGTVCVVLTADCLPVLICNKKGTHIAAAHAGWRGLVNGVIESTLNKLNLPSEDLLVWLGPAISRKHFEVGSEVRDQFLQELSNAESAFTPSPRPNHWMADLYELARIRLRKQGITQIYGGEYCTYANKEQFYSYRRDGANSGRMASLIWIDG